MSRHFLFTRTFWPLFVTQFLGALNDNIYKNALMVFILFRLPAGESSGALYVTAAAGIFILPFVLFSGFAGDLTDRFDKARIMRIIKAAEILIVVLGISAFYLKSPPFLLAVLFLMGTHSAFFSPAKYSILPQHLKPAELVTGNGLLSLGTFTAILTGTIAGALGISAARGTFDIALTCLAVAVFGFIGSRFIPPAPPEKKDAQRMPKFFASTRAMFRSIMSGGETQQWAIAISWFWFLGAGYLTQFPAIAKQIFYSNEQVVTLFLVMFTIGVSVGSGLCGLILRGRISTALAPFAALVLAFFGIDFYIAAEKLSDILKAGAALSDIHSFMSHGLLSWRVLFDLFMVAVAGGVFYVPLYARVQSLTPAANRARVMAGISFLNAVFMAGASLSGMAVLALGFPPPAVVLVNAVATIPMAWYCKNPRK